MNLYGSFKDTAPRASCPKVTLGGKKPASSATIHSALHLTAVVPSSSVIELLLNQTYGKRGKSKVIEGDKEVWSKRLKGSTSPDHTPIIVVLLFGENQPAVILDKISALLPPSEDTLDWSTNQISEQGI